MTADALLSRLRELAEKATPAPWRFEPGGGHAPNRICGADVVQVCGWKEPRGNITNASYSDMVCENFGADELPAVAANIALIVALRNSLPSLLSRIEAGEKLAEALERIVSEDQRAEVDSDGEEHQADGFFAEIARAALAAYSAAKEKA